jgi:hypothetical protein
LPLDKGLIHSRSVIRHICSPEKTLAGTLGRGTAGIRY